MPPFPQTNSRGRASSIWQMAKGLVVSRSTASEESSGSRRSGGSGTFGGHGSKKRSTSLRPAQSGPTSKMSGYAFSVSVESLAYSSESSDNNYINRMHPSHTPLPLYKDDFARRNQAPGIGGYGESDVLDSSYYDGRIHDNFSVSSDIMASVALADSVTEVASIGTNRYGEEEGRRGESMSDDGGVHGGIRGGEQLLQEARQLQARQMYSLADDTSTLADTTVTGHDGSLRQSQDPSMGASRCASPTTISEGGSKEEKEADNPEEFRDFLNKLDRVSTPASSVAASQNQFGIVGQRDPNWTNVDLKEVQKASHHPGVRASRQRREQERQIARLSGCDTGSNVGSVNSSLVSNTSIMSRLRRMFTSPSITEERVGGGQSEAKNEDAKLDSGVDNTWVRPWWEKSISPAAEGLSGSFPTNCQEEISQRESATFFFRVLPILAFLSGVALSLAYFATFRCNFLSLPRYSNDAPGQKIFANMGVFCPNENIKEKKDLAWDLSKAFAISGLLSGFISLALLLAQALFYPEPTEAMWGTMAMICAITSVLEVSVFMIFGGNMCITNNCGLEVDGVIMVLSCVIWFVIALVLTSTNPPINRWDYKDDERWMSDESSVKRDTKLNNRRKGFRMGSSGSLSLASSTATDLQFTTRTSMIQRPHAVKKGESANDDQTEAKSSKEIFQRVPVMTNENTTNESLKKWLGKRLARGQNNRKKWVKPLPKDEAGDEKFMLERRDSPSSIVTAQMTPSPQFHNNNDDHILPRLYAVPTNLNQSLKKVESDETTEKANNTSKYTEESLHNSPRRIASDETTEKTANIRKEYQKHTPPLQRPPPSPKRDSHKSYQNFWNTLEFVEAEANARRAAEDDEAWLPGGRRMQERMPETPEFNII